MILLAALIIPILFGYILPIRQYKVEYYKDPTRRYGIVQSFDQSKVELGTEDAISQNNYFHLKMVFFDNKSGFSSGQYIHIYTNENVYTQNANNGKENSKNNFQEKNFLRSGTFMGTTNLKNLTLMFFGQITKMIKRARRSR